MITKFRILLYLFYKSNILLKKPKNKSLVVIDSTSIDILKNILDNFKNQSCILETRNELIKEIYITPKILLKTLLKWHFGLKTSYLIALIEEIKPKLVLTFIDNSLIFSKIAKKFKNSDVKFFAIQNGWRGDICENNFLFKNGFLKKDKNKEFYLPDFFCLGQNDISNYKKYRVKIKNFYKLGSLRLINALKKKQEIIIKQNFDICFICNTTWGREQIGKIKSFEIGYLSLLRYAIKISKENNIKIIFCLKQKTIKRQNEELNFVKTKLTKSEFIFFKKNCTYKLISQYSSYSYILKSNIIIGLTSTLLGESLALKKKVLSCNYTNLNFYDFPVNGICFLKKKSYELFEIRVKKILQCSYSYYEKNLNKKKNYIVNYQNSFNPEQFLTKKITDIIQTN